MYRSCALVDDGGRARLYEESAIGYDAAPCGDSKTDDESNDTHGNFRFWICDFRLEESMPLILLSQYFRIAIAKSS